MPATVMICTFVINFMIVKGVQANYHRTKGVSRHDQL